MQKKCRVGSDACDMLRQMSSPYPSLTNCYEHVVSFIMLINVNYNVIFTAVFLIIKNKCFGMSFEIMPICATIGAIQSLLFVCC